ncbi:MAG: hypothetical protein JSU80_13090 [Deltaproteobacteria bacterium]|nr:MAG: hypothetical protein JSU80_13090 [Deltaproteobacteria bacterium]
MTTQSVGPHLCQPDKQKSCAWCCGLYNNHVTSRAGLARQLRARTEEFARTRRTVEGILNFSERNKEKSQLLDPEFYSCEFVGFLNEEETRVGCMLHPLARGNGGTDWRGLSFHGAMACQGFFCRSYRELSTSQKEIVLSTVNDWFLFGLVISDADFIYSFFRLVAENLIDPATLLMPASAKLVHEFFHWKIDWPFGNSGSRPTYIDSRAVLGTKGDICSQESEKQVLAPLDQIFVSLSSKFSSPSERQSAEEKVNHLFSRLCKVE